MRLKVSYAQNGEDIRVWRALRDHPGPLHYVDVGANEPRDLSITASLYDLGWRGVLIEADPDLAEALRVHRPGDSVVAAAAGGADGALTFHRVPGTGLGTLDATEAQAARDRGFEVSEIEVPVRTLDGILDEIGGGDVHFMTVDVEGAEAAVLAGLRRHRPWILCVEAIQPGTTTLSHESWEPDLLARGYRWCAFDGVNRWYVADEHADLAPAVAVPFHAIDTGADGWVNADTARARRREDRGRARGAWQRELILHDIAREVPRSEYERQIEELRSALVAAEGSRAYRYARRAAGSARAAVARVRGIGQALPGPLGAAVVRRRHVRHVRVNMGHLTDPAYLGHPPADEVDWLSPEGRPPVPAGAITLGEFDASAQSAALDWLAGGPWDDDESLDRRTDNHGDELGRTIAALRTRLALAEKPPSPTWAGGRRILLDARSLQASAFGTRGIGRFARAALVGLRESVGDDRITLLVDPGLAELPAELVGGCAQVTRVTERTLATYSVLVQPSPMTASADPLLPLLHSTARRIAIVFDLIPLHYPTVYLRHPAARAEYAAGLDALRLYDDVVCISHLTRQQWAEHVGRPLDGPDAISAVVAWPRDVLPGGGPRATTGTGPIVVMTGDEPRKNTFGALAGVGAATAEEPQRDVIVIGMSGQDTRVHHWSIAAAMRPGEARTLGRVSDEEMDAILADASAVVVASFDEGLSLPVIEAVRAGAPVVASDIPAHRELIGRGTFLADPADPASIARAVRRVRGRSSVHARQSRALARHQHEDLETTVGLLARMYARPAEVALPPQAVHAAGRTLRIGIGTPWVPQRTGVADFSTTTTIELARLADVTAYVTTSADVPATLPPGVRLPDRRIEDARPGVEDVFVSVVGNSHYHLPFLEVLDRMDAVVVSHDTRLVELYLALRGAGGAEQVMTRNGRPLRPPLDDQISDMRLLQDAGFWEVARRARMLVLHSPSAAPRIEQETGVHAQVLPFANQRVPRTETVTPQMRTDARQRLGLEPGRLHLASFGYVDLRTKMTDAVVESAAWLTQWGHPVALHLVGAAHPSVAEDLTRRARSAGLADLSITGFVDDETFRDYLLAIDVGVQLRISPLLGVSGPLSDLAAFGTPAVASRGLAIDVAAPDYVRRLPDEVSPVMVAEAVEEVLAAPPVWTDVEAQRRAYLERQSPRRYAELLLDLLHRAAS